MKGNMDGKGYLLLLVLHICEHMMHGFRCCSFWKRKDGLGAGEGGRTPLEELLNRKEFWVALSVAGKGGIIGSCVTVMRQTDMRGLAAGQLGT